MRIHALARNDAQGRAAYTELEVVADRLRWQPEARARAMEAIEVALRHGQGHVVVHVGGDDDTPAQRLAFSAGTAQPAATPLRRAHAEPVCV